MSEIHAGVGGCHASRGSGNDIARTADWLYLSAAPTFAMMALLTAVRGVLVPPANCCSSTARICAPVYVRTMMLLPKG